MISLKKRIFTPNAHVPAGFGCVLPVEIYLREEAGQPHQNVKAQDG
jgi:hypothetical protein